MATPIAFLSIAGSRLSTGAANAGGKVRFVSPTDTGTQVNVYKDAEKDQAWTQPITLNDGGKVDGDVFADQDVRILVSNSSDVQIEDILYPNGVSSAAVEIIHVGFRGEVNGASTAGARTNLYNALSSAHSSLGGTDFKFKESSGGTERSVVSVVNEFGLSVKSRGAKGDGAAIDTTASTRSSDQSGDSPSGTAGRSARAAMSAICGSRASHRKTPASSARRASAQAARNDSVSRRAPPMTWAA